MEKKKKKVKVVRHVLHKDCKICMRERHLQDPLIKELNPDGFDQSNITLLNLNNSLEYLRRYTKLTGTHLVRIFTETGNPELSKSLDEYFTDIEHVLEVMIRMKRIIDKK